MESLSTRQQIIVKMAGALVSNSSNKIEQDFYPKTVVLDAIELTDEILNSKPFSDKIFLNPDNPEGDNNGL